MKRWLALVALAPACGGTQQPTTDEAPATAALVTPAAEPTPEPLTVSPEHPHVVMITLDTFRADRLGANGYDKAQTDTLDALARAGLRFSRAYSPLPLTIPSHSTMFTGKYPPSLDIRSNGHGLLRDGETTLAEVLHGAGYATAASVAAFVTTKQWGFSQGFDAYFDEIPEAKDDNFWHGERRADAVIDDILGWKATVPPERAQMIWVHLYDAHFPYQPPEGYVERAEGRPYDAEIAFVDDQVQRLVDAYAGAPTLFVIAGDHGEGLGEHHELTHGMQVYSATQHVPMFLSGARVTPGVVDTPVSLADLMPTVLSILGLEAPAGMEGRVVSGGGEARPVYMETYQPSERFKLAPHVAIVDGRWKYIDTPRPELYDLTADPGERVDVSAQHPEELARLDKVLDGFGFAPPGAQEDLDPSVAAQLQALGYVEGGEMPDFSQALPDPKDHVDLLVLSQRSERQMMQGRVEESLGTLSELIEKYPHLVEFRTRKAQMLRKRGDHEGARELIEEALALEPDNPNLRVMVAGHLAEDGKFDEAAKVFHEVALAKPYMPRVRTLAVVATRRAGRVTQALDMGLAWLEEHPDDASLAGMMGVFLVEIGKAEEGVPLLERGVKAAVPEDDVAYFLGARAVGKGDMAEARRLLELELEHHPMNMRAAFSLLRVYMGDQAWDQQLALAERMIEVSQGRDTNAWHAKVLALFNQEKYSEAREALAKGLEVDPEHPELMLMDANLLAKEGKMEQGKVRFDEAKASREKRQAAIDEMMKAGPFGTPAPPEGEGGVDNPLGLQTVPLEAAILEAIQEY